MNKNAARKSAQVTGNIGLFYACFRLSLLGLNVMPTARNAKGIDLLIYNEDCSASAGIQVKTRSVNTGIWICEIKDDNPEDKVLGDFWIVVPVFSSGKSEESEVPQVRQEFARQKGCESDSPDNRLDFKFPPALIAPTPDIKSDMRELAGEQNGNVGSRGLIWKDRIHKQDGTKNKNAAWWLNNDAWWPLRKTGYQKCEYREAWGKVADLLRERAANQKR